MAYNLINYVLAFLGKKEAGLMCDQDSIDMFVECTLLGLNHQATKIESFEHLQECKKTVGDLSELIEK